MEFGRIVWDLFLTVRGSCRFPLPLLVVVFCFRFLRELMVGAAIHMAFDCMAIGVGAVCVGYGDLGTQ